MGIEPMSSAWKAEVLPLNYSRLAYCHNNRTWWREVDSNHRRHSQLIYSQPPLAAWVSLRDGAHYCVFDTPCLSTGPSTNSLPNCASFRQPRGRSDPCVATGVRGLGQQSRQERRTCRSCERREARPMGTDIRWSALYHDAQLARQCEHHALTNTADFAHLVMPQLAQAFNCALYQAFGRRSTGGDTNA